MNAEPAGAPASRWKPYSAYKDSGVEWLGEVPEQWEIKKLKHLARLDYGDSLPAEAREVGDVPVYGSNGSVGFHSHANTLAPALVIGRKGSFGKINYSDKPCFAIDTTYFIDSRKTRSDLRWLFYILQLLNLDSFSEDSAVPGLSREFVYDQWVIGIPLPEQHAIASFLDRQTAHLDALMSKKERLIALLEEKRAALISSAVTKGLDPNAAMKDSGVEWLGKVPEHWRIIRLKYAFILMRGFDLASDLFIDGRYPVCASNGIIGYHDQYTTVGPSITVGRSGSVGEVNYIENNFWAHNTALYVKNFKLTYPRFTFYLLKTLDLKSLSSGSAVGTLNRNYIHDVTIAIPNYSEQKVIASFLDCETAKIDALIAKIRAGIERLREYRTALISAAVTGKIDVREATGLDNRAAKR